jgi:predicted transcriptional regulator
MINKEAITVIPENLIFIRISLTSWLWPLFTKILDKKALLENKITTSRDQSTSSKIKGDFHMATEILNLTAQIVSSHASMSELTSQELVEEIKKVYDTLSSLESGAVLEIMAPGKAPEQEVVKKPSIPLKDIVTRKHVVCLECEKKLRTLRTHIWKAHGLTPKEYFKSFGLDPKKYPLVCKEYSEQRRKLAMERGLGALWRKGAKKS